MKNEVTINTNDLLPTKDNLEGMVSELKFLNSTKSYSTKKGKLESTSKAPFSYYLIHVLKRDDKMPRGQFFKGKRPGPRSIIMDEYWTSKSSYTCAQSPCFHTCCI